jgi:hypothetical protein
MRQRHPVQQLVVDGSPDCVRAVHAEMRDRIRDLLASEGCHYHPDAVRVLQHAALVYDVDSREHPPHGAGATLLRLRHWAAVWFSSAGVGTTIPWAEQRAHRSPYSGER